MNISSGTTVGPYEILSPLGAGGMGEVWLARDTRLERKVAIKLLPAEFTKAPDRVRRFEQEAKAASALNHPHIVTIHEIGESEAGRFIVMEFIEGQTLGVLERPCPLEKLFSIAGQIAKALAASHAAGITHRDIKPDNIMVRDDGYVKVLDFGLARLLPTSSGEDAATLAQQTTPGMLMGTVAYMSPEQSSGQSVNPSSDIFSLGIVLYELATGRHPFHADTLVGYLHAIALQTPPTPSQLRGGIPAALDELILRMLGKDAGQRPLASEVGQAVHEMERRGNTTKPQHGEGGTMILPTAPAAITRTDEGFWVAVLPFKYRGGNADLEALAEGLSEDIVTGLSRFSYLRVISRSSTLRFSSEASDIRAIGKELGARYVMEGSLRQAGATVRLAVQLVDATTGAHLWAETFDRHFQPDQIFSIQDELIPRIVSTCADRFGVLARSISDAVRWKDPSQLSPYEALMRGFGYHHRLTPSEHAEAREVLERAVEQAPGNADCWAMLSWIYSHEYGHGFNPRPGSLDRALAAARRAVDLAPSNHLTYQTLATALFFRKDIAGCLSAAERAMALNPLDASNDVLFMITFTGDWERGCSLISRAMELNPHHPGWYELVLAINAYRKANYREAVDAAVKANVPGIFWTSIVLAAAYGQLGELEAAGDALRNLLAEKEDFAESGREALGKWFDAALVEHLIEGLRKAGLGSLDEDRLKPELHAPSTSIAVLPFANMSADDDQDYFCDGLAEELLNALSKIKGLRVAARTSAFSFKGRGAEISEIGQKLKVNTVLEGSVRKSGKRLRITAQLINVADGYHLWSERYDREMQDIFDIQDDISLAIVDALKVRLLGDEKAAVLRRYTDNTEAYQLYLLGRFHYAKWTWDGWNKAIEYFQQAIEKDPDYAPAFAVLANSYFNLWWAFGQHSPAEYLPKAQAAAARALEIDNELAESHMALAALKFYCEWDFAGGEIEFKRAIELNPNYAVAHEQYGLAITALDRADEAIAEGCHSLELDPLSLPVRLNVGWIYACCGQFDRMAEQGRKMIDLEPGFFGGHWNLGIEAWADGRYDQAISKLKTALDVGAGPIILSQLGCLYGIAGDRDKAEQVLRDVSSMSIREPLLSYLLGIIHAGLGDLDRAFELFEVAREQHAAILLFIKTFPPSIPGFGTDPRLADLLQRMGLPG